MIYQPHNICIWLNVNKWIGTHNGNSKFNEFSRLEFYRTIEEGWNGMQELDVMGFWLTKLSMRIIFLNHPFHHHHHSMSLPAAQKQYHRHKPHTNWAVHSLMSVFFFVFLPCIFRFRFQLPNLQLCFIIISHGNVWSRIYLVGNQYFPNQR